MKNIHSFVVATVLGLVCFHARAKEVSSHRLCVANDEPVFSCTLQGNTHKMVSLCASPASAQGERTFRYLFGYPSKIELTYPSSDSDADSFTLTHLVYAGATGGSAYAFTNDGYKYILYSIEGTGLKRSGLLVQHVGQLHAASDLNCTPSALVESGDELIPKWKADQDIDAHGLPSTR